MCMIRSFRMEISKPSTQYLLSPKSTLDHAANRCIMNHGLIKAQKAL